MVSSNTVFTALLLLLQCSFTSAAAAESPRRLRVKGMEVAPNQKRNARQGLVHVEDIHSNNNNNNNNLRMYNNKHHTHREQQRKMLDDEDEEIIWEEFLIQGRQGSFNPIPAPTLNAPPVTAPVPAPIVTLAPVPATDAPVAIVPVPLPVPTQAPVEIIPTEAPVVVTLEPVTPAPVTPDAPDTTPSPTLNPSGEPVTDLEPLYCGCFDCTQERYDTLASGFTCGERIIFVIGMGSSEEDACRTVAGNEFPDICGPACDPDRCDQNAATQPTPSTPDVPVGPTTTVPVPAPTLQASGPQTYCGCDTCTEAVWNTMAGLFTCGELIESVMDVPIEQACSVIAGPDSEFAEECSACDPLTCSSSPTPPLPAPTPADDLRDPTPTAAPVIQAETRCGCPGCGGATLDQLAGDFTCLARIDFLISTGETELDACRLVAGTEFGDICGPNCDPDRCDGFIPVVPATVVPTISPFPTAAPKCGCNDCAQAYNLWAGESTCGERIEFLMEGGAEEEDACRQVAGVEYPFLCGPSCDPDRCDDKNPPLEPRTPLYCYPPYDNRTRYENVWGDFILEVKEDDSLGVCDPSFNRFTPERVSVDGDELTLQYQKNGDFWEAAEVRIVLPEDQMPFQYGTFSWNVKSIAVKNVDTGVVRQDFLPPDMVLGMFTWDSTEDFTIRENYSHEVDVELGRFGRPDSPNDVQFLVQPATEPNLYRFSSQDIDGNFRQAPETYSFTWNPSMITWETTAGGGVDHFYSTEQALELGLEDYVQCLPADVEVRINLWSLGGALLTPMEMADNEMVEVVIDSFTYTPTGLTGVEDGGTCTKDCQCLEGSECMLGNNQCTPIV